MSLSGTAGAPPAEPLKDWYTRGYLPHLDREGKTQFITFRLHDSLPAHLLDAWRQELRGIPDKERLKEENVRIMRHLDAGSGACHLRLPEIARLVESTLLRFHDERYDLQAWVVMPNHVHVLARPFPGESLPKIVHSWKSYTAHEANRLLGQEGAFWYREFYDRYIRDEEHYANVVRYIEHNPVKAGLCARAAEFVFGSAGMRGGDGR